MLEQSLETVRDLLTKLSEEPEKYRKMQGTMLAHALTELANVKSTLILRGQCSGDSQDNP